MHSRATSPGRVLAVALSGTMGAVLPLILTGTLAVQIKAEFVMSDADLGIALAVFAGVAATTAVWGGRLADWVGWRTAICVASVGSGSTMLGIAFIAQGQAMFLALLALGGLSQALASPTGNLALAQGTSERQGLMFGIKQTSVPGAGLLAGLAVPLVAVPVGWRWAFALAALVPVSTLVITPRATNGDRVAGMRARRQTKGRRTSLPRSKELALLATAGAFAAIAVSALSSFLVVTAVASGIGEGAAGFVAAVASATGLMMRVLSGWAADRRAGETLRWVTFMLVGGAVGFVMLGTVTPWLVVAGGVVAYGAGWGWPGLFHYGVVRHYSGGVGQASGTTLLGLAGGGAIGPLAFGFVADTAGYMVAWLFVAVLAGVAGGLVWKAQQRLQSGGPAVPESVL